MNKVNINLGGSAFPHGDTLGENGFIGNRSMKCPVEGCEERIIVNDVLAQIPTIGEFIK